MADPIPKPDDDPRLADADASVWLAALDDIGDRRGYYEPLGAEHSAVFTDEGPVLLVTFETMAAARARPDRLPLGFALARPCNWSQLTVLAHRDTWFRDPRVYGYFDRLVDDGFFEDFDRVIFWGEGICGYAACAFSVAAPGATVIAVQPQATQDPLRAGWDPRFGQARRLDFTDRYGFAPRMIEAADRAFLLYDPQVQADAIHAAFFTCDNTALIRCRRFGGDIAGDLARLDLLPGLLSQAASPQGLREGDLYRALRARRDHLPYLRALVGHLAQSGQWMRLARVTRVLTGRYGGRRFQKAHAEALARLRDQGRRLPARSEPAEA